MTAAVTVLAKRRGGVTFRKQVLLYPVSELVFYTNSDQRFVTNCWLTKIYVVAEGDVWDTGVADGQISVQGTGVRGWPQQAAERRMTVPALRVAS